MSDKLEAARQLVEHAAKLTERGDLTAARRRLDEAGMTIASLGDDDDAERLVVAASVHEGKGQIAMQVGRLDEAYLQLTQTIDLLVREGRASGQPRHLNIAIAHINLSSTCSQLKRLDEALEENARALTAFESLGDLATARFMRVATLQARAMLLASAGNGAASIRTYDEAIDEGTTLLTEEAASEELPELLTQVKISAAVTRLEHGQHESAQRVGNEAADEAWTRFEVTGSDQALGQYLTAQMNLVTICEKSGDFAAAEDALFRVLKLVGHQPEALARGRQLYKTLLELDDATLEAGNLPRDEVEESLEELEAMIAEAAQA